MHKISRPAGSFTRTVRGGVSAGVILIVSYFFQTQGLRFTTASKSAFITGLSVVLVPLLGSFVYRKVPGISEAVGVGVATLGMALLTMRWDSLKIEYGDALTLVCAIGYAIHILVIGHFSGKSGFELLSITQIATAAFLGWATFWWMETPRITWSAGLVAAALGAGVGLAGFHLVQWGNHSLPTSVSRAPMNLPSQSVALLQAARDHSQWMLDTDTFAHDLIDPPLVLDRDGTIALPSGAGVTARIDERRVAELATAREVVLAR